MMCVLVVCGFIHVICMLYVYWHVMCTLHACYMHVTCMLYDNIHPIYTPNPALYGAFIPAVTPLISAAGVGVSERGGSDIGGRFLYTHTHIHTYTHA